MIVAVVAELAVVGSAPTVESLIFIHVEVFHVKVGSLFEVYHVGWLVLVDEFVGIAEVLYRLDEIGIGGGTAAFEQV